GDALAEALEETAAEILAQVGAVRADVQAVHDTVKEMADSVKGVEAGVREVRGVVEQAREAAAAVHGAVGAHAADTARRLDELQAKMAALPERLDMRNKPVEPGHSLSIRTDRERELVKDLLEQVRALPDDTRAARPELVTDVGKLQIAVGDFSGAGESFAAAATLAATDPERAEAHHNAYRAKLEQDDYVAALEELKR